MSLPSNPSGETSRELPPSVRSRVIALADETLAAIPTDEVPSSLRAVRRFTPAKRARLGAASIGAALEGEPDFRAAVVARVREALPAVVAAVESARPAPAVASADLAAVAYLLQAPGWQARVAEAAPYRDPGLPDPPDHDLTERLHSELGRARKDARAELGRLRDATIHLKARHAYPRTGEPTASFFHELLAVRSLAMYPQAGVGAIEHLHQGRERPTWLQDARRLAEGMEFI